MQGFLERSRTAFCWMPKAEGHSQESDPSRCLGNRKTALLSTADPETHETVGSRVETITERVSETYSP